jgi:hypothetical protein
MTAPLVGLGIFAILFALLFYVIHRLDGPARPRRRYGVSPDAGIAAAIAAGMAVDASASPIDHSHHRGGHDHHDHDAGGHDGSSYGGDGYGGDGYGGSSHSES